MKEDDFDGVFTSHQYVDDSGFVDFLFVGEYKGKEVIWNACMTTADGDYYENIHDVAVDISYDKYPMPEGDLFTMLNEERRSVQEPRWTLCSETTMEMLDSKEHPLPRWNVDVDESYKHGVGLHIRVDVPAINIQDVKDFIHAFLEKGPDGVFADKDLTPVAKNAEELGVERSEDGFWVRWVDGNSRDTVAVNMGD